MWWGIAIFILWAVLFLGWAGYRATGGSHGHAH